MPGTPGSAFPLLLAAGAENGDSEELSTSTGAVGGALVEPQHPRQPRLRGATTPAMHWGQVGTEVRGF